MTHDPNVPSSGGNHPSDSAGSPPQEQPQEQSQEHSPEGSAASQDPRERRGPPPNPLYHPFFLPVLLVGFSLWFFWDGFVTSDPDMLKHQLFNRVCFGITALLCLRVVPRGIREYREDQEAAKGKQ